MSETLKSILAADGAFIGFSIAALIATIVVAIGLFLEYERHELFGASKKQIGALMVAGGVAFEALFGAAAFSSASIRESRLEMRLLELSPRVELLYGSAGRELSEAVKPFAGQKIETRFPDIYVKGSTNEEAMDLAMLIPGILRGAGWNAPMPVPTTGWTGQGLWVYLSPNAPPSTRKAASALSSGLRTALVFVSEPSDTTRSGLDAPSPDTVLLLIGSHPLISTVIP